MNKKLKKIHVIEGHRILGHPGKEKTKSTLKKLGIETYGELDNCENCAMGKARRENLNRESNKKETNISEKWYEDVSSIKGESIGGSKFWSLWVDAKSTYMKSFF